MHPLLIQNNDDIEERKHAPLLIQNKDKQEEDVRIEKVDSFFSK